MERKQNEWGHHPSFALFKVYALIKVLTSAPEYTRNVTPVCISTCCILRCTLGLLRKFCVLGLRWYCPAGSCGISVAHHKTVWDSSDVNLQLAKAGKLYRKQGSCAHLYQLKNWSIFLLSISVSLAGKTAEALIYHLFPWASKQKGRCCSPNNEV